MPICPQCHTEYPANVRLCTRDGTPLESAPSEDQQVGQILDGKYRIDAFISQGGMGAVYRATHVMLGKTVAVKLIRKDLVTSPDIIKRFQREARAASALEHRNIVSVYDLGQTPEGTVYFAMEFITGQSLKDVIQTGGPMAPARIVAILEQVSSALSRAHRNHIIHRDLKPQNIMLTIDPEGREVVRLVDFGIAKTFEEGATQLTMSGFALGTPQYMSPEQASGAPVDGRSDLYSLGIILYEMLIGEVPFSDPSFTALLIKQMNEIPEAPSRRRPDLAVHPALEAIALRCMQKDPTARFQTADEFAAAVGRALGADSGAAAAPTMVVNASGAPPLAATARLNVPTTMPMPKAAPPPDAGPAATVPASRPAPAAPAQAAIPPVIDRSGTRPTVAAPAPPPPMAQPAAPRRGAGAFIVAAIAILAVVGIGAFVAIPRFFGSRQETPVGQTEFPSPSGTPAMANPAPSQPALASREAVIPPAETASVVAASGGSTAAGKTPPGAATRTGAAAPAPAAAAPTQAPVAQAPPPTAAQAPVAPARPAIPTVFFSCRGATEICAPLRVEVQAALEKAQMPIAANPARAQVVVTASVETLEQRVSQQFGTTFATRQYSIDLSGESSDGLAIAMPPPRTVSFDQNFGRERANEASRLVADDAVTKVQEFWAKQK